MIRHIVMFRVNAKETKKTEQLNLLRQELEVLPSLINEIKFFELGTNISESPRAYDFILVSKFENRAALSVYQKHPEHQKVLLKIKPLIAESVVVDYEN